MLQVKGMKPVLGCYNETIQCLWLSKTVSEIKGYLKTAIDRPTYLATSTLVAVISVFI